MGKLFSKEETAPEIGVITREGVPLEEVDLSSLNDTSESLDLVTEHMSELVNKLDTINTIRSNLVSSRDKGVVSLEYFTTLENYYPIVTGIVSNLGIKSNLPALEDYSNRFTAESSYQVTMEGLKSFIKNVWKKIYEWFRAFFKKMGEFFKRLAKADLELDTYEKYIPKLISTIKSKNLELEDKSPLRSKLPSYLANPGMDKITNDFILTTGRGKINNLYNHLVVSIPKTIDGLTTHVIPGLKSRLSMVIETVLAGDEVDIELGSIVGELSSFIAATADSLTPITAKTPELPREVYEQIVSSISDEKINDLSISSLVDPKDMLMTLPKGLNLYRAISPKMRLIITSHTEVVENVSPELTPITTVNNLSSFYDDYKKTIGKFSVKNLQDKVHKLDKSIDDIMSLLMSSFSKLIDDTAGSGGTRSEASRLMDCIPVLQILFEHGRGLSLDKYEGAIVVIRNQLNRMTYRGTLGNNQETKTLIQEIVKAGATEVIIDETNKAVELLRSEGVDIEVPVPTKGNAEQHQLLLEIQQLLVLYFQNLQAAVKNLTVNMVTVQAEVKYEVIKYIYNSAIRYK